MQGERGQGRRKVPDSGNLIASLPFAPRLLLEEKKCGASRECRGAGSSPRIIMYMWFSNLSELLGEISKIETTGSHPVLE